MGEILKGYITGSGVLHIFRKGRGAEADCPDREGPCNDNCVFFGEPYKEATPKGLFIVLNLCRRSLRFTELEDNRSGPKMPPERF